MRQDTGREPKEDENAHHVAMTIKGLHSTHQFVVVAHIDQNLCVGVHCIIQNRERTHLESFLFRLDEHA